MSTLMIIRVALAVLCVALVITIFLIEGREGVEMLRRFWKWLWKERESMTENEVKPPKEW